MQLSVPKTSDEILLTQEAGKQFAKLEVRADTLEIKAADPFDPTYLSGLSIHANQEVGAVELRTTTDSFLFNAGDSVGKNALYLHKQGNVGIGTTNPREKLEVSGRVRISEGSQSTFGGHLYLSKQDGEPGSGQWHLNIAPNNALNFVESGIADYRLVIQHGGNVGIGTDNPQAKLHVNGDLIGAAQDISGRALRICSGKTSEDNTAWQQYPNSNIEGIFVDVDTSACGFKSTPFYIVSTNGDSHIWEATGGSSAYRRTEKGFRVYLKFPDDRPGRAELTPRQAQSWKWHVQWIALGI